jgi:hypothetical protein
MELLFNHWFTLHYSFLRLWWDLMLFHRFNHKNTIWGCGPWWTLSLSIPWSFLLSCSWYQSMSPYSTFLIYFSLGKVWSVLGATPPTNWLPAYYVEMLHIFLHEYHTSFCSKAFFSRHENTWQCVKQMFNDVESGCFALSVS